MGFGAAASRWKKSRAAMAMVFDEGQAFDLAMADFKSKWKAYDEKIRLAEAAGEYLMGCKWSKLKAELVAPVRTKVWKQQEYPEEPAPKPERAPEPEPAPEAEEAAEQAPAQQAPTCRACHHRQSTKLAGFRSGALRTDARWLRSEFGIPLPTESLAPPPADGARPPPHRPAPGRPAVRAVDEAALRRRFDSLEGDGTLGKRELYAALRQAGLQLTTSEMLSLYRAPPPTRLCIVPT